MTLEWAVLAQHAAQQADGTFSIIGAGAENFGSLTRESLPPEVRAKLDEGVLGSDVAFQLIARFRLPRHEFQRGHKIEADILDVDGASAIKMAFDIPQMAPPPGAPNQTEFGVVAHFQVRLSPKKFGPYSIALFADTASLKSIPFQIVPVAAPPQQQPA